MHVGCSRIDIAVSRYRQSLMRVRGWRKNGHRSGRIPKCQRRAKEVVRKCTEGGRREVVIITSSSAGDSPWYGLAQRPSSKRVDEVPALEAIGNHPPTGSKGFEACGLQAKPRGRPFRCIWTYRAGGPDATPPPARDVRPAPASSVRPTSLSAPPPEKNRLRGMAGGKNFPLARSLAGDTIVRALRARTIATRPGQ
eukprot:2027691-Pleurochrysis_carterae.AAC.1